ncbi:RING-H2 finger protein ATL40-like [Cocos nucifera]|uniref:RING-type E3 ubiquitin transferase n=1 Tax=Cocos nucifera TaxID=13894 RepID=A0A8K0I444_COCNU|nr:RING-H2 finger protein ATL40-like [Cocos nucifera]
MSSNEWRTTEDQTRSCCRVVATLVLIGIFLFSCVVPFILYYYSRNLLRSTWQPGTGGGRHCATAGLAQHSISTLPTFTFRRANYRGGKNKGTSAECAVCIDSVEDGEIVRLLPNCEHVFHVECIDMWLHSHSTCPLCRTEAEPGKMVAKMVVGEVDLTTTAV